MATTQEPLVPTIVQWRIDPAHNHVEFAVKHLMISTVKGRFKEIDGTVREDTADLTRSSVELSIKAASIDTADAQRDAHLRSPDFLDAEQFPYLTFRSTRIERSGSGRLKIPGDLTIRGVTNSVVLDAKEEGRGKDPWGGERAGYSATTTIKRSNWGLNWNQALELGGWVVGDEVKITIEVELLKQD